MKVSIIVPVYNGYDFLGKCLDSLINQVYKNIEIIVIDDCSTDKTKEVIKEYTNKDKRIIAFYQSKNKGVSAARNVGIKASTGDYLMFVDSDDALTKEAIRRMVDVANKYDSDLVDSYHLLEYEKGNGKILTFTEKKVPKNVLCLGTIKDDIRVLNMTTYMTGKIIKKDLMDNLLFDETLRCYEDMPIEHKIKDRVKNYTFLNKPVYIYYQRPTSLVNTLGKSHLCFLEASKQIKEIYKDYDKNVKDDIEATLVTNMFLTAITKIVKNDDTIENNIELTQEFLKGVKNLFPNYKENKKIKSLVKKYLELFIVDKDKLKKFIIKTQNINFINLYFTYLSIKNKYILKNPLE
jgi:glycosyltransferase involved in cell wall biosynthesis